MLRLCGCDVTNYLTFSRYLYIYQGSLIQPGFVLNIGRRFIACGRPTPGCNRRLCKELDSVFKWPKLMNMRQNVSVNWSPQSKSVRRNADIIPISVKTQNDYSVQCWSCHSYILRIPQTFAQVRDSARGGHSLLLTLSPAPHRPKDTLF